MKKRLYCCLLCSFKNLFRDKLCQGASILALVRLCNHLLKRNGLIYIEVFGYEVEAQVCQNAVTAEYSRFVFDCYSIFFDNTSKIMRNSSSSKSCGVRTVEKIPLGLELNKCYCGRRCCYCI